MADFRTYKCRKCGYKVLTEPQGHYALMSGSYYNFKCTKCKEIVSVRSDDIGHQGWDLHCPKCGADNNHLFSWNPVEGHCPKCNRKMYLDEEAGLILAD